MGKHWRNATVSGDSPILDAVKAIDKSALQIALVIDGEGRLEGVVTDGDVRRAILAGRSTAEQTSTIMNRTPTIASPDEPRDVLVTRMNAKSIRHIPLVTEDGVLTGMASLDELLSVHKRPNLVVLMAGGLGERLRPLTDSCPKPMLKVGDRPILETIIGHFQEHGFHRFLISVNYMGTVIEEYFGDGSRLGAEIRYLREDEPLGTAGALSRLPEKPEEPFFVMNGDLLTKLNFANMLQYHIDHGAPATMSVREHEFTVPYGVVEVRNSLMDSLIEKPVQRVFINAGIYVLEPSVLAMIPANARTDMTDLLKRLIDENRKPAAFPIHEYWVDIGQIPDFFRATSEYGQFF